MKKVILSMLVVGSLLATSCKKEKKADAATTKTEEVAKETVKKTEEVIDGHSKDMADSSELEAVKKLDAAVAAAKAMGIEIPAFDKPELTQNLADYAGYAKDYLAAKGNVAEITKLAPKGAEILKQGQELLKGANAETVKKFTTVLTAIQSKMAPAK